MKALSLVRARIASLRVYRVLERERSIPKWDMIIRYAVLLWYVLPLCWLMLQ